MADSQESSLVNEGGDDPNGTAAGLRRSKRNKYHLNLLDVLKSGTSSHRDYSPPTKKWATRRPEPTILDPLPQQQPRISPRKNAAVKKELVQKTTTENATNTTTEKGRKANAIENEVVPQLQPQEKAPPIDVNLSASLENPDGLENAGEHKRETAQGEKPEEVAVEVFETAPPSLVEESIEKQVLVQSQSKSISGGLLPTIDIQLPDQILEEDDFPATTSAPATAAESSSTTHTGNNIPSPNDPKKVATSSNPSFMLSSSEVVKRKRKVPLRHLDYTNDDSSDLDEERMFKAIKVEYTVTDGTKAADDHSCPRCPAIFESRVGLTNHLKLHGSKKHFPCELCDFSCTNKKTMRQHRRVHGLAKRPKRESLKVAMAMKSVEKAKKQSAASHESIGKEIKKEISTLNKDLKVQALRKEIKCEEKGEMVDDGGEKFIVIKSLDEIGAITEKGSEKAVDLDAEGMPILEQQEDISKEPVEEGKPSNEEDQLEEEEEATNDSNSTGTRKNDRNLPLGFYKKGSRIYDRNTVKCPYANCPFRTQSKVRLNPHVEGHNRPVGFVCSICLFKSDSTGHLRRHCQLHRDTYKWPPDYEGIKPTASAVNGTATIADLEQATNDRNIVESNSPGQDHESEKQQQPQQEKQQQIHIGDITAAVEAARKMGYEWGGGEGEDQQQRCWEGECAFVARIKGEMFAHRWRHHREKFFPNLRADSSMSFYKSNCIQCGLLFRSGPVGLTLHRGRHHTGISKQMKALCRELLEERLAWRPVKENAQLTTAEKTINLNQMNSSSLDEDDKAEKEKVMITQKSTDSNSKETDSTSNSSSSSKIYNCRSCPYTTDQIFRLQKHENKHLVKAEYQCSNCSFSCRSLDILAQHNRLHEINTNSNPPSPALKPESEIASSSVDESQRTSSPPEQSSESAPVTQKLLSFRRNETHYCPYCPYKSKHNCDMKAHLKMHEERRKFICNYCSYSTMRQNALLAHEKIHQIKNAEKGKCRRMKVISNRVKGVGILTRGPILGERMQLAGTGIAFYRCAVKQCAAEFPFCAGLTQHARHHQWAAGMKAFTCPTCDFKTDLEKRMQSHQTIHRIDEEKNIRSVGGIFHCKECPYATANYAKFWNHRQKHKRKARFACTHCSFSSGSVQCYAEHLELHNKANGNEDAGANNLDQKEEKEDVKVQNGDVSKKEDNSTVEKLNNQPLFQRDKYELFSSALPVAQLKLLGVLGKSKKEQQESGSTSSSSISSFSKAKHLKYCKECPYKTSDSVLLKLHQDMHRRTGTRPFSCTLCTFGCFSAESLHTHLSLHASTTGTENVGDEIDPAAMLLKVTTSAASSAFQCSQCNFKCIELEGFLAHRKEHVQLLQQRLMTIIKRSGNENVANNSGTNGYGYGLKDKVKSMRGKQTDKQHYCSKCSFRCDSVQAFSLHWEHHNNNNNEKLRKPYFRCTICDYSSDTKNVVIFHEKNHHHLDVPLTSLYQQSTQVQ